MRVDVRDSLDSPGRIVRCMTVTALSSDTWSDTERGVISVRFLEGLV